MNRWRMFFISILFSVMEFGIGVNLVLRLDDVKRGESLLSARTGGDIMQAKMTLGIVNERKSRRRHYEG